MKFKKLLIPKYIFQDELGDFEFKDVEILIEADEGITADSFDQNKHDYTMSSKQIKKLERDSARRFFNSKYSKVLRMEEEISSKELNGIRLFLGANGSEFASLLSIDKSGVSRILKKERELKHDKMILAMEKLKNELETPGITSFLLAFLKTKSTPPLKEYKISPIVVAEWIVRKFDELEEGITNLKLQKLLYYAQGIGIGRHNVLIMDEEFLAWQYGPVNRTVYDKYKSCGKKELLQVDESLDLSKIKSDETLVKILNEMMQSYGKYSAWSLAEKTHNEQPWLETQRDEPISIEIMREFFKGIVA